MNFNPQKKNVYISETSAQIFSGITEALPFKHKNLIYFYGAFTSEDKIALLMVHFLKNFREFLTQNGALFPRGKTK